MSQHRSLRAAATLGGKRNVLKRFERTECSRNAANGKTATALPVCARPSRTRESVQVRSAECRMRIERAACSRAFFFPIRIRHFARRTLNGSPSKISRGCRRRFAPRREQFILEGRVAVNGQTVAELGTKVDPLHDNVRWMASPSGRSANFTWR